VGKFHNLLKGAAAAFALAGMALVATSASADLRPELQTVSAGPAPFTWSYNLTLSNAESIRTGDFVVIYDFAGYTGAFTTSAGWALTTQALGPMPVVSGAVTDTSVTNLILTYSGANVNGPLIGQPPSIVGSFTAGSIFGVPTSGTYEGMTHDNPLTTNGSNAVDTVQGNTFVPLNNTPEAGSLALLLPGLVPVGMAFRRRLKKA